VKSNNYSIKEIIHMTKLIVYEGKDTNYEVSSEGKVFNKKTGKELKGTFVRNEYHSVQLTIEGKPKTFMVHRLVAEAFCENPNNYAIVDHIDRNKLNNNASNLRWVDSSTNAKNVDNPKRGYINSIANIESNGWREVIHNPNYLINKDGMVVNKTTRKILKGSQRNGYIRHRMGDTTYSAHLLVWEVFKGGIPQGMVIDHIDGNRANNSLDNLRLVTQSENMRNAQLNGHKGQVKISQYSMDGSFIKKYDSIRAAANEIGGSECAIKGAADRHGSSGGYLWIRDDQNLTIDELLEMTPSNKSKSTAIPVSKYTKEGKLVKEYSSFTEAAKENHCSASNLRRAAKENRLALGYYWILNNNDTIK
jgi:uncharacterized HNH endonuclease L245